MDRRHVVAQADPAPALLGALLVDGTGIELQAWFSVARAQRRSQLQPVLCLVPRAVAQIRDTPVQEPATTVVQTKPQAGAAAKRERSVLTRSPNRRQVVQQDQHVVALTTQCP